METVVVITLSHITCASNFGHKLSYWIIISLFLMLSYITSNYLILYRIACL